MLAPLIAVCAGLPLPKNPVYNLQWKLSVNHKFFHKPCRKLIWDFQVNMNEISVQQAFKVKIELIFALCKTNNFA
ncbi:MAG: hypothetical protein HC903_17710 [Methylacidiphilales bacterium]|nr:hypothetical protein [Candidatus Methylacidiphilales bacterium]NJR15693.1 hypothetical protein [Calothrix sp. CSU_2_0]